MLRSTERNVGRGIGPPGTPTSPEARQLARQAAEFTLQHDQLARAVPGLRTLVQSAYAWVAERLTELTSVVGARPDQTWRRDRAECVAAQGTSRLRMVIEGSCAKLWPTTQ